MSGYSSLAAVLLAMMMVMMTMFITKTDCFSINQTITVSSTWCDGLNDDLSCLTGQIDLDSDEFMLDSEFSRRILAAQQSYSGKALNPAAAMSCGRTGFPPCHTSGKNKNPQQHTATRRLPIKIATAILRYACFLLSLSSVWVHGAK